MKLMRLVRKISTTSSSSAFSLFRVGASSFQSPSSPVFCFFYLYLFLLHVFSYNITPPQFRSSYLLVSTHFHLPCSHYYIVFSLSLNVAYPSQSRIRYQPQSMLIQFTLKMINRILKIMRCSHKLSKVGKDSNRPVHCILTSYDLMEAFLTGMCI